MKGHNIKELLMPNRDTVKYIAVIAMVIDHIAYMFMPSSSIVYIMMRFAGRVTGPAMAYFIAEGYRYTRSRRKYIIRLITCAAISWIPSSLFKYGAITVSFGAVYSLLLGLVAICVWDNKKKKGILKPMLISTVVLLSYFGDWAIYSVIWCLVFHMFRETAMKKWTAYCMTGVIYCIESFYVAPVTVPAAAGVFLVPLLIECFYTSKQLCGSRKHRRFFYVFYPVHFLVLILIKYLTSGLM